VNTKKYEVGVLKTESINFEAIRGRQNLSLMKELTSEFAKIKEASERIDAIKKHLFYGKELKNKAAASETKEFIPSKDLDLRLIHALCGLITESSELIDGLHLDVKDDTLTMNPDMVNVTEEIGDILWYAAVMCNASGYSLEKSMKLNLAKLEKRYGKSFSEKKAIERDVKSERIILEKK
jgi:NTP pyrophosphatase (non-canonical NTP hydrolase)